ncbi:MAG: MotA/TolQ/ExbB proton channel family protein [candidate division KSB1 bacterium]|nr:MotA/TolQ/ExbB proton channel family protein [candidate division KSB1 bacterium]MDZ7346121.1 MotA/TolQ/ExbB proton channel family protein [candidate division KSB1 bacterium]
MQGIIRFFVQGGPLMYAILLALLAGLAVIIDRMMVIRIKNRIDAETFVTQIVQFLKSGAVDRALEFCSQSEAALPRIVRAGLLEINRSDKEIQSAMELAAMVEIPKLERRTHYLAMLANVSTLLGLLGTILGLISAFAAVAHADAADKASLLTAGISVAMNTTAFGIISALPCLVGYTFLMEKTNELIDEINENVARLFRYMTSAR